MQYADLKQNRHLKKNNEYNQCTILWRNLPALFKTRWRGEAESLSISGYRLFIRTNMNNLINGNEIKIAPWY